MARIPAAERTAVSRGDRAGLWLVAGVAVAVAVLAAVSLALSVVHALGNDPLELQGLPLANARTPEFTAPLEAVTSARYESVALTVTGVPAGARWLVAGAVLASALAVIGVCLTIAWLCRRVLALRPFGRSVTTALVTSAVLIIVGGAGSQVLRAAGNAALVEHLGPEATGSGAVEVAGEGLMTFALDLDLSSIGVGVALAVVALAFQLGARMQRDTEGLV